MILYDQSFSVDISAAGRAYMSAKMAVHAVVLVPTGIITVALAASVKFAPSLICDPFSGVKHRLVLD
jgi:hypothetical protein